MEGKEYNYGKVGLDFTIALSRTMPSRAAFVTSFSYAFNFYEAQAKISMLCKAGAQLAHKDGVDMLKYLSTRMTKPLGLSKGMDIPLTQMPTEEEMERMLADRIKNKFKVFKTQEKINFKKVWVEHNYQTNTIL